MLFEDFLLEKEIFGKTQYTTIRKNEPYLIQAFTKLRKSISVLKDERDKGYGITIDFINAILDKKMDEKDVIKSLYKEIWEHVRGKYKNTLSELDALYKESIEVIAKEKTRKVIGEKIARFYLRSRQFEKQGFYGGLAKAGDNLDTFNDTMKEILDYYSNKK